MPRGRSPSASSGHRIRVAGGPICVDFRNSLREIIDRSALFEEQRELSRRVHVSKRLQDRIEEVDRLRGHEIERPTHFKSHKSGRGEATTYDFTTHAIDESRLRRRDLDVPGLLDGEGMLQSVQNVLRAVTLDIMRVPVPIGIERRPDIRRPLANLLDL